MGNSRRGLAAGVNFIWDSPMTLLLSLWNITSHRRRLSKPEFNSIQFSLGLPLPEPGITALAPVRASSQMLPQRD